MKILALRGENIASLAGPFELDFADGILARTGLFAICGPTGAGKSSLLDAMCLALFDATPRMANDLHRVEVGLAGDLERIGSNDVRNVLTRGTASGFAEVDFLGVDGDRYRARWSLRRARKRASGKLQAQQMSFENLDTGRVLGEKKTITKSLISQALGLDFDQFRRSALLAQGEFATFLRAKSKERGELLEQMTGTNIYARISKATYLRAKDERIALAKLRELLTAHAPMDDAARAQLDREIESLRGLEAELAQRSKTLELQESWFRRETELRDALERAGAELEQAREGLGELLDTEGDTSDHADAPLPRQPEALSERVSALRPRLHEAARAEAALEQARAALEQARERQNRAQRDVEQAAIALQSTRARATELGETIEAIKNWQHSQRDIATLAEHWPVYEAQLQLLARVTCERARIQSQLLTLKNEEAPKARLERSRGLEHHESAQKALADHKATIEGLRSGWSPERYAALGQERDQLARAREQLTRATDLLSQAEQLDDRRQQCQTLREHANKAQASAAADLALSRKRCEQAETQLHQIRASLGLEQQRLELQSGQPCPLCGATEHPYSEDRPDLEATVPARTRELEALQVTRDEQLERHSRELASMQAHTAELERLAVQSDELAGQWRTLAHEAQRQSPKLFAQWPEFTADSSRAAIAARRAGLEQSRQTNESALAEAEDQRRTLERAREHQDRLQNQLDQAESKLRARQAELAEIEKRLATLEAEAKAADDDERRALAVLEPTRSDGEHIEHARAEGVDYVAKLGQRIADWRTRKRELENALEARPTALANIESAQASHARADAALEQCRADLKARETACAQHERQRAGLFGGAACSVVEHHLARLESALVRGQERREQYTKHVARDRPELERSALTALAQQVEERALDCRTRLDEAGGKASIDDESRRKCAQLGPQIAERQRSCDRWNNLDRLLGEASGAKFRNFAQGLTLRIVLAHANEQLARLRPRYELMAVPGHDLDIQIIDHDLGDEVRAVSSLSGGETFLVSLALALGLAHSGGRSIEVRSVFIDEGFGTLDGDTLDVAIAALDALQAEGRSIAVISHVEGLAERLGAQVKVSPIGGGRSRIEVVDTSH